MIIDKAHSVREFEIESVVPRSEVSTTFVRGMFDRMGVSYYKYGPIADGFPNNIDAIASLKTRLEKYEQDGNGEWLMDVANFAMIEYLHPAHPDAHFAPQDSDTSPGRTGHNGRQNAQENGARGWQLEGPKTANETLACRAEARAAAPEA